VGITVPEALALELELELLLEPGRLFRSIETKHIIKHLIKISSEFEASNVFSEQINSRNIFFCWHGN
jgi:hypothetical protein